MSKAKDYIKIGHTCGFLTIIEDTNISKQSGKYWLCKCICGKEINVSGSQLNSKNKRSIKSCGCRRYEKLKTGSKDISGTYMSHIISSAKKRQKEFNLTIEYLQDLWDKQNGICAISGVPINMINKKRFNDQTASLDRVDSSIGYVEGNVQWVHKKINIMKTTLSDEEFIDICENVVNYHKSTGFLEDR